MMKTLREVITEAENKKVAVGHFNISDLAGLKAIFESARELELPIIIGVSEGERDFIGVKQCAAFIKSLRETYDYPIYLNADHTHSLEKAKEAAEAGFDAIIFDGSKLDFEENIKQTKEAVVEIKKINPSILVEGEVGYIGSGSVILKKIPKDAATKKEDFTKPEEAKRFVEETGVDLFSPAVGNLHGMLAPLNSEGISTGFANAPNPDLAIDLISQIKQAVGVPLVLHGGSGIKDPDFTAAIQAGITIIHINTEIRLAWRKGLEAALKQNPDEIAPYKLFPGAIAEVKKVVLERLRLFNGML